MIGVAVVSLFTVFGASLKATMDQTVNRSFAGDLAISTPGFGAGGSGLSPKLAPALAERPEVSTAVGLGRGAAEVDGEGRALTVTDPGPSPSPSTSVRSTDRWTASAPTASRSPARRPRSRT